MIDKFFRLRIDSDMKKICIVFGGNSVEHDISIITGMQCSKNIENYFDIEKIYLGLDNNFYLASRIQDVSYFHDKDNIKLSQVIFHDGALYKNGIFQKKICDISCVINCCHGGIGENGDLAGFFETNKIAITSSDSLASHIAMNKALTKKLVEDIVPTIKGIEVRDENFDEAVIEVKDNLENDLIVKPNSMGSSIGVKVCDQSNFIDQILAIKEMGDTALVENRVINLKEYNQACILDGENLILSEIEEPITKSDFLTFEDKYNGSKTKGRDRIIPAKISKKLREQICSHTRAIYRRLNMHGVVRIDYIFDTEQKKLYFNEINTIPGSLAYYLYEPIGIDYISLIDVLVKNSSKIKKYSYFNTDILKDKKI